jgi:putative hemolysin
MPLSDLHLPLSRRQSPHPCPPPVTPLSRDTTLFEVEWARDDDAVREAQQLRYLVFVQELGARLSVPRGSPPDHDIDVFDTHCEHLLVRAIGPEHPTAPVIGTYRVLTPAAAKRAGGLYSDTEFDLTRLRPLRAKMVELGRSCVHPAWRSGGVILALWGALAEFMVRNDLDTMIAAPASACAMAAMVRPAFGSSCARDTSRPSSGRCGHDCRCPWRN